MDRASYVYFEYSPDWKNIINWVEENVYLYRWETRKIYSPITGQYPTTSPSHDVRIGVTLPEDFAILLKLKFKNVQ